MKIHFSVFFVSPPPFALGDIHLLRVEGRANVDTDNSGKNLSDAAVRPAGSVELTIPFNAKADGGRLRDILVEFGLPGLVLPTGIHLSDWLSASLICEARGVPLSAYVVDGRVHWELIEPEPLARVLCDTYGPGVSLDGDWFGVDENNFGTDAETALELEQERERDRLDERRFVWATREHPSVLPIAAHHALQSLGVAGIDGWLMVSPLLLPTDLLFSRASFSGTGLTMWRYGDRRGIIAHSRMEQMFHTWDEDPQPVDPTHGWERDDDGSRVSDYLSHLVPEQPMHSDWAKRFALDEERAERLRVCLRHPGSTAQTFLDVADILGVPSELADLVEGRVELHSLPGYSVVHPATAMETFRASLVTEFTVNNKGPLLAWYRFSTRHPLWRFVITTVGTLGLLTMAVARISREDYGMVWVYVLGLVLWGVDILLPRPREVDQGERE